jgi:hypothetical protein
MFGLSLITSHASASLSGTRLVVGIIAFGDALSGLVAQTLGMSGRGDGKDISFALFSGFGLSDVNDRDCIDVGRDVLEQSAVDGFFDLHKRDI